MHHDFSYIVSEDEMTGYEAILTKAIEELGDTGE